MDWTEWIIAIVNIVLVAFVFLQVKHTYRPILTTKILSREKSVKDDPSVLEYGDLYSVVSNVSPNLASTIKIEYTFLRAGEKLLKTRRILSYLSPSEATREPLGIGEIITKYPELFEEHSKDDEYIKIPKETLKLNSSIFSSAKLPEENNVLIVIIKRMLKDTFLILLNKYLIISLNFSFFWFKNSVNSSPIS